MRGVLWTMTIAGMGVAVTKGIRHPEWDAGSQL